MSEETKELEKRQVDLEDAERTRDRPAFVPRADIYETDEAIFVVTNLPGVDEDTVDITLEKDILTINGTVEPAPVEGYELVHAEYRVGDYVRRFSLSNEIDQDNIQAAIKNGVLSLTLPKLDRAKTRKISVKPA
jgi:HSP20 family protein